MGEIFQEVELHSSVGTTLMVQAILIHFHFTNFTFSPFCNIVNLVNEIDEQQLKTNTFSKQVGF